jgi:Na+(H+)/acetate symporter ActP
MEDIFRLVRIVAVLITAVVISLVGGCQAGNWVQAQKDITLARGLTDPVAQRLWALGKVLDGVNAGSYAETAARKESLIREIFRQRSGLSGSHPGHGKGCHGEMNLTRRSSCDTLYVI